MPATPVLASAIGLGLVAGLAAGGRLTRLADLRLAWWPVLLGAVALRIAAGYLGEVAPYAYVVAFAGVVAVALADRHVPGMALIALGAALNLVVVALNGAMPVSREAIALVGGTFPTDALHRELDPTARLVPFADVIPFPLVRTAYSVGDVLIAAGGFWLTFMQLRRR